MNDKFDFLFDQEEEGAEYEKEDQLEEFDNEDVEPPFDPTKINILTKQDTLVNLIERLRHDEINLQPPYQRNMGLWLSKQQSRLIESILIRIPLPAFYFDCTDDALWEVIDGLQRLSIIKRFVVDQSLALSGLEYLKNLNGLKYDSLDRQYIRRINECPITYFQITPGTNEEVKYSIFRRINTGGVVLNEHEMRNALAKQVSREFLLRLSQDCNFINVTRCSSKIKKRMKDQEMVLRFLAFYQLDAENESFTNIAELLDKMMTRLDKSTNEERNLWDREFRKAMERCNILFGERAFEKSTRRVRKNTPLYEVWSVSLAKLEENKWAKLLSRKENVIADQQNLFSTDTDFERATTIATQKKEHINIRYKKVKEIIDNNAS